MKRLILLSLLTVAASSANSDKQTFVGVVTDDVCAKADHSQMQMGPTDAECTRACVSFHGASYVLYDGKNTYKLSDQQKAEKFAGQKVSITGTVDTKTKTILVSSLMPSK